jgi:hypothetical protein
VGGDARDEGALFGGAGRQEKLRGMSRISAAR